MMLTALAIYIAISAFLLVWIETNRERPWPARALSTIIIVLLCPIEILFEKARVIWPRMDAYFQVRTIWRYVFKPHELIQDVEDLQRVEEFTKKERNTKSLRHRFWRFALALTFQVNNYKPS